MRILGLSFDYHDAAAGILVDGKIVAAAQEERFSRVKHDDRLPHHAIDFCLEQAGCRSSDLDFVAFYEQPLLKFDRVLWAAETNAQRHPDFLESTLRAWLSYGKFEVRERIAKALGLPEDRIRFMSHHDAHLASAYYCSPFQDAAIVSLDGVGEYETAVIAHGRGTTIERLDSVRLPHSIGLFYSAFTAFLGFEVNEGEYKVMGMAAFGQPVFYDQVRSLFTLHDNGTFSIAEEYFEFLTPQESLYTQALIDLFGAPRLPESPFAVDPDQVQADLLDQADEILLRSRHYANIAASVQRCTEDVILHLARHALARTGSSNLCLSGGVALNSLANGRIRRELGCRLYVQPAAGDSGSAIGAAAHVHHALLGLPRMLPLESAYLGRSFDDDAIAATLRKSAYTSIRKATSEEELLDWTAGLLADGHVVGWFQGRAEWGPRALGNRSILANPCSFEMQRTVNEKIKFREPFRPFAPSVLEASVTEYFDVPLIDDSFLPEYYMLAVHAVREDKQHVIPAVSHADGSARVHVVSPQSNERFAKLIAAFAARTGVPVLLNTSFNLRGEPVVDSPSDALKTFSLSGMDYLVLGSFLVSKDGEL